MKYLSILMGKPISVWKARPVRGARSDAPEMIAWGHTVMVEATVSGFGIITKSVISGKSKRLSLLKMGQSILSPAWIIPNGGIITLTGIDRNPKRFVKEQGTTGEDKNGKQIF